MNRSHGYDYPQDYDFWIWYIVGGLLLLVAASSFLNTVLFLVKAKSVPGAVIELGDAPKVSFWEETRERRFEVISSPAFSLKAYNEDERITVFYDPENSENAKTGDFIDFFVVPTFFFLMGAFSCL